jgi:hypothetical protein
MHKHDPFPIEQLPDRARKAVLAEFQGRCPTVLEVACIPDTDWLKAPDIGPAALSKLRALTPGMRRRVGIPSLAGLSDAELLARSKSLRKELIRIQEELKAYRAELTIRGISPAPKWRIVLSQSSSLTGE